MATFFVIFYYKITLPNYESGHFRLKMNLVEIDQIVKLITALQIQDLTQLTKFEKFVLIKVETENSYNLLLNQNTIVFKTYVRYFFAIHH